VTFALLLLGCRPVSYGYYYADCDGDGYGDPHSDVFTELPPEGYVDNADDCDDTRADTYPLAPEYCDGRDHDCDGQVLDTESDDATTWWSDADGDGHGDPDDTTRSCLAPTGFVAPGEEDCDDDDPTVHPLAEDLCADGIDSDCDGVDAACGRERSLDLASWSLWGDALDGTLGASVALATDGSGDAGVTHDDYSDAGCWGFVVEGGATGDLAPGDAAASVEGLCVALSYDDLDGDGLAELVGQVGVHPDRAVVTWAGPVRGAVGEADAVLLFEDGYDAAPTPDQDGDGQGEVWIAVDRDEGDPLVLLPGPGDGGDDSALATIEESRALTITGLTGDQDLDGDGEADLVVGLGFGDLDGRKFYGLAVFLGPHTGSRTLLEADGLVEHEEWWEPGAMAAGDLDGDGLADLAFAVLSGLTEAEESGLVHWFPSPLPEHQELAAAAATWEGVSAFDAAGSALVADADTNGDGQADLVVGTPGAPEGWNLGGAQVLQGPLQAGTWTLEEAQVVWLGEEFAWAGGQLDATDTDGDGAAEILLGGSGWSSFARYGAAWLVPGGL